MVVVVLISSCQVSKSVKRIVGAHTTTSATQNVKNGALLTNSAERWAKLSNIPYWLASGPVQLHLRSCFPPCVGSRTNFVSSGGHKLILTLRSSDSSGTL